MCDGLTDCVLFRQITTGYSLICNFRILFGSNHLYVFQHPAEHQSAKQNGIPIQEVSYDEAQEEIARCSGIDVNSGNSGDQKGLSKCDC